MSLSSQLMAQLSRIKLQSKFHFIGQFKGEHRSINYGVGLDFADYRPYQQGDELSHIDWNLYARSGRRFIKLFQAESALTVSFLIDNSVSMCVGDPNKIDLAKQITTALSYTVLNNSDQVQIYTCQKNLIPIFPLTHGLTQFDQLITEMNNISPASSSNLAACLQQFAQLNRPGLVILISDFFDHSTYQNVLTSLVGQKFEIALIQILSQEERKPDFIGEVQLTDIETGKIKEIVATPKTLFTYQKKLEQFLDQIEIFCRQLGMTYLQVCHKTPLEQIILKDLQQVGLIKAA